MQIKKVSLSLLIIVLTAASNVHAQYYRIKPTEAEMNEARTYKAQYKDDEFLITSTEVKYTFERLKDKNIKIPFVINENTTTSITCLKEGINTAYSNTSFYDQNSEIVKFSAFAKNGKPDVSGI